MNFTAVVDTSALIELFVNPKPNTKLAQRLFVGQVAAPELLDVEVQKVVHRLHRSGVLDSEQAQFVMGNIWDAPITRLGHQPLRHRAWAIRHTVSAYDAFYVASAEQLGVPLVTCDGKLARAHGHEAEIELYPVS
ncbi:type II toxin-antitoxin system VapC family toxin [Saccharothrix algeriensis]|uniref:Ribonuclease VapC n=1 Tax=Saccharothrix algeriensis TaxID=173560 RepID=A0A8T8HZS0_9PSEU|nr:type II toxin-antitoxin system VapC family toxin [Saccharothrix algeriensis]MBM7809575.1 putative nucleic acid-binding protein [Saccharothrix algeriensis]QTR03889.1 type II toxin-antitoxin system VapC family toxin [Saccharothrix algeriensis]